jgi:hypothetical protein
MKDNNIIPMLNGVGRKKNIPEVVKGMKPIIKTQGIVGSQFTVLSHLL